MMQHWCSDSQPRKAERTRFLCKVCNHVIQIMHQRSPRNDVAVPVFTNWVFITFARFINRKRKCFFCLFVYENPRPEVIAVWPDAFWEPRVHIRHLSPVKVFISNTRSSSTVLVLKCGKKKKKNTKQICARQLLLVSKCENVDPLWV